MLLMLKLGAIAQHYNWMRDNHNIDILTCKILDVMIEEFRFLGGDVFFQPFGHCEFLLRRFLHFCVGSSGTRVFLCKVIVNTNMYFYYYNDGCKTR